MANRNSSTQALLEAGRERAKGLYRSRRLRMTALVIVIVLLLFGLFGFLIAPGLIKNQLEKQLSAQLAASGDDRHHPSQPVQRCGLS